MQESSLDIKSLIKLIRKRIKKTLDKKRYAHSLRVAKMCVLLAVKYHLDKKLSYFMGLSHDMCKGSSPKTLEKYAKKDGGPITSIEKDKPDLLHGRAAAVLLSTAYSFNNKEILEAIACHTYGKVGLGEYGKVLFIADKIEPGRPNISKKYLKSLLKMPLDKIVVKVLKENIKYVKGKHYTVSAQSNAFLNSLTGKE